MDKAIDSVTLGIQIKLHIRILNHMMVGETIKIPVLGTHIINRVDSQVNKHRIASQLSFSTGRINQISIDYIPVWKGQKILIEELNILEIKSDIFPSGTIRNRFILGMAGGGMRKKMNRQFKTQWEQEIEPQMNRTLETLPVENWDRSDITIGLEPPEHFSLNWPLPEESTEQSG